MSDPIDRQAAYATALAMYVRCDTNNIEDYRNLMCESILALPSVQPEIIRCKDCKHQVKEWREDKRFKDDGYWVYGCEVIGDVCGYWALFGHNDEFCSDAEPKGEQDGD